MENASHDLIGMDHVAGVDGVTGGWVIAITGAEHGTPIEFSTWSSFADVSAAACEQDTFTMAVDIPVGLPGAERRAADLEAHAMLGPRRSSLFWTPPVRVLRADSHEDANRLSRECAGMGVSKQFYGLIPKIREVRAQLDKESFCPSTRPRVVEVHPEVSFTLLTGTPMSFPKKNPKDRTDRRGAEQRLAALIDHFPNIADALRAPLAGTPKAALDDVLDAAAAAWTARRIVSGEAVCLGEGEFDATGYPMNIWV